MPGPRVVMTTPIEPVSSAVVAAANAAAVSVRVSTNLIPAREAASITSRLQSPPGTPKMCRTLRSARRSISASTAVLALIPTLLFLTSCRSARLRAGNLDHLLPPHRLAREEGFGVLRRPAHRNAVELAHALGDVRRLQRGVGHPVDLVDDFPRRPLAHRPGVPHVRLVAGKPRLLDGRHVGEALEALRRADGEHADGAALDLGEITRDVVDRDLDAPGGKVDAGVGGAAVGDP